MKYSIITINFNNKEGLRKTIESVIHQTFRDFEYIIIDGGSKDGSKELIEEYSNNIDYWVSEKDNGIYHAMNKGVKVAHGDYLNFMNSGDCFYNYDVLKVIQPFLTTDIVEGKVFRKDLKRISQFQPDNPSMMFFFEGSLDHQATFIKRILLEETPYDETLKISADWKFFTKKIIFENCTFSSVPIVVATFEGQGISAQQIDMLYAERQVTLDQLLPKRVLCDYQKFQGKESPILNLIPKFNKTYRLHILIIYTIKTILRIYTFFRH